MKKSVNLIWIDYLVIILHITFGLSLVKVVTFDLINLYPAFSLLMFMLFCHAFRFGLRFPFINNLKSSGFLSIFIVIYIADCIQNIILDPNPAIARFITLVDILLFMSYVSNIIKSSDNIEKGILDITKPYLLYSTYNLIVVFLSTLLILFGILSPMSNEIVANSLTNNNVESGQVYYFPGLLSLATQYSRLFYLWGLPQLTGLSHEPHVFNYLILPSMFFLLSYEKYRKYKVIIYIIYGLLLLIVMSTIAALCFMLVLCMDILWSIFRTKVKIKNVGLVAVFVVVILIYGTSFFPLIQDELLRKTIDQTGSIDYSSAFIRYIITPTSLFGKGNIAGDYNQILNNIVNVGLVVCILDIVFYITLLFKTMKLVFSRKCELHYIGLGCMYMILHSIKVNVLVFNYPYFAYIVLLIYYANTLGSRKINKLEYSLKNHTTG